MNRHLKLSLAWVCIFIINCFVWFTPTELGWFVSGFMRGEWPEPNVGMPCFMYSFGAFVRFLAVIASIVGCLTGIVHHYVQATKGPQ